MADLERNTSLRDFYLLYEEANINRFAPEIKTLEKCGPEVLKKRWESVPDLRLFSKNRPGKKKNMEKNPFPG